MAKTLSEVKAEMLQDALQRPIGAFSVFNRNGKVLAHSKSAFEHIFTEDADKTWAIANGYQHYDETMDDGRVLTFFKAKPSPDGLYQSADGSFYTQANLPENTDSFVTAQYASKQKAERNTRLSDTDKYAQIGDMTVKVSENEQRRQLTDAEKAEVSTYRQNLRDLPEQEGFPFIDFPTIPTCIAYEVSQAIAQRKQVEEQHGYY